MKQLNALVVMQKRETTHTVPYSKINDKTVVRLLLPNNRERLLFNVVNLYEMIGGRVSARSRIFNVSSREREDRLQCIDVAAV